MQARRWVQVMVLLLLGVYLLDNILSGHIYLYVNRFGWLTWFGAGACLLLGTINMIDLIQDLRASSENQETQEGQDCEPDKTSKNGNDHVRVLSWLGLAILAFPLVVAAIAPTRPLGAAVVAGIGTLSNNGQDQTIIIKEAPKLPNQRNMLDWIRIFSNSNNLEEFNGQQADLIGFVYRGTRFKNTPQQFMVARFFCCDKDESPIGVMIQFPNAGQFVENSWIRVKGKFQVQVVDGQPTPILIAETIDPTTQPANPYLPR